MRKRKYSKDTRFQFLEFITPYFWAAVLIGAAVVAVLRFFGIEVF